MLKISSKQQKIRQCLLNNNYQLFVHFYIKLMCLKQISPHMSKYMFNLFQHSSSLASLSKLRSICILTGRSRSVYRMFKMSRSQIRSYSGSGYFVGLTKSSW